MTDKKNDIQYNFGGFYFFYSSFLSTGLFNSLLDLRKGERIQFNKICREQKQTRVGTQ